MVEDQAVSGRERSTVRRVVFASCLGTVFEWYDFFLYGSLAGVIARQFFSALNESTAYIFALLAFASGFVVRPFGAAVFGRLGDLVGRKYTFLITISIMGLATFAVGLLPGYAAIGIAAPVLLITMRLLQGLAVGGEYGGAAIYVAEHVAGSRRGRATAWVQTTATIGLILSLLIILACRLWLGEAFEVWGWRIPFLFSLLLLGVSVYVRLQLAESPVYQRMKAEGRRSQAPLREAFGNRQTLRVMLAALFGPVAGVAVIWYTAHFYTLFFLGQVIKIDTLTTTLIMCGGLLAGMPLYVAVGALSDRVGRKPVVLAGCLLSALLLFPLYRGLVQFGNPALARAAAASPVTVVADPGECKFQFDPIGRKVFNTSCDVVKAALAKSGVPYHNAVAASGSLAEVRIGIAVVKSFHGVGVDAASFRAMQGEFNAELSRTLSAAGYPAKAEPAAVNKPIMMLLIVALMFVTALVYSPIAAWLVESFPTRVRYTAVSIPYHVGVGWLGGFVPTVAYALVTYSGDIYFGLWYPVLIAGMAFVVGLLWMRETAGRSLEALD